MGWKVQSFLFLQSIRHRLSLLISCKKKEESLPKDWHEKILLSNWASLGDLFLSTMVLQAIRRQFPKAKIGFLVSKSSQKVLTFCEGVDFIHEVDSLAKNYSSFWAKMKGFFFFFWKERRRVIDELKKENYSCAIELYPFFPNTISLFWQAKIPFLIGFGQGGSDLLLDLQIEWKEGLYLAKQYETLLHRLGLSFPFLTMPPFFDEKKNHLVLHPFSSLEEKDFPLFFWQKLYLLLKKEGFFLFFTGDGEKQREKIEKIGATKEENLCGKLSWKEFVEKVEKSRGLISVDTVAVHVAAFFDRPLFLLYQKEDPLWIPSSKNKKIYSSKDDPEKVFQDVKEFYTNDQK